MTRPLQVLLAMLFLVQALPTSQATHLAPEDLDPRVPDIPEEEVVSTDIVPLDRFQRNTTRAANDTLDPARSLVQEGEDLAAAADGSTPRPDILTLFKDDLTTRIGGYGGYAELGPDVWGVRKDDGQPRIVNGILAGGRYAGNARALAILPELDLRTGFADPLLTNAPAGAATQMASDGRDVANATIHTPIPQEAPSQVPRSNPFGPLPEVPPTVSMVHRFLVQAGALAHSSCLIKVQASCLSGPHDGDSAQPTEGLYVLEFDRRMNLAKRTVQGVQEGRDGVQMLVFTQRPTLDALASCVAIEDLGHDKQVAGAAGEFAVPEDPVCTIVRAVEGNAGDGAGPEPKATAAFAGGRAYTGYDDWRRLAIDLTPWAERQVWVGFLFASGNTPGDVYFRNEAIFEPDAGFFGMELDNFTLTAPAMPHSIRVRPIHEPWHVPYQRNRPTLAIGEPLRFATDVVNVGTRSANVTLEVKVLDRASGASVWNKTLGEVRLDVGDHHPVRVEAPGLTGDLATYTVVVDATRSSQASGAPEADATDSIAQLDVDVATIKHLLVGSVERSSPTSAAGDNLTFELPFGNDGNAPLSVVVLADLVNVATRSIVQGVQENRTLTIPTGPLGSTVARWSFLMQDAGQYRLFVRIDDPDPFDAMRDLRPQSLQPRSIPFVDGVQVTAPVADGVFQAGEWPSGSFEPIQLKSLSTPGTTFMSGSLGAAVSATTLFLGLEVPVGGTPHVASDFQVYLDTGGKDPYVVPSLFQGVAAPKQRMEAAVPLQAIGVAPGGTLGILVMFEKARFPQAGWADGEGFQPPNNSTRDEMDSWRALRLASPSLAEPRRLLSLGVGVDRAPPPILEIDGSDCSDLAGWTQSQIRNPGFSVGLGTPVLHGYHPDAVKWNCAPYGPDGRTRIYEGRTPLAQCNGVPCGQWSSLGTNTRQPNWLISPPIDIPDIPNPYLILRHQYATQTYIVDEGAAQGAVTILYDPEYAPYASGTRPNAVIVPQKAQVMVQERNPDGTWGPSILLRPEGGYSSEESVGIANPAVARGMVDRDGDVTGDPWKFDGWWWPTGNHPHYIPAGSPIATGGQFSGSPWTVDRIPLFGPGHGAAEPPSTHVSTAGKTIRLLFSIPNARDSPDPVADPPRDFGWRIEGIAIAEGRQFARDIAVTEVAPVSTFYDPHKLGLGPDTDLPVEVTVANRGTSPVDMVSLCVRAVAVGGAGTSSADPCAAGSVKKDTPVRLAAGSETTLNVTLRLPDSEGAQLTFQAGAFLPTTGDDFPSDNVLRNATASELRRSPNLAIEVGSDQPVASVGQSRALFVKVVNRGNVPVEDFVVKRRVSFEDGSTGGSPILGPDQWTSAGTLAIGAAKSLDEIAMTPAVVPTADLRMPAVSKSGAYTFTASVGVAGDIDPTDNAAALILRTQDTLVSQGFSSRSAGDGLAQTGTPGVWAVHAGSLLAGDPALAEIPVGTDATIELTTLPIDLRSAKSATLTLKHRFDLEASPDGGFDAGIVEVSTDGVNWRPLRPQPNPLQGMPDGYSSLPLTGDSNLAAETLGAPGVAFTGRSADLPGADAAGWIRSQFDLAQDADLSRRAPIDAFSLAGLGKAPDDTPRAGPGGQIEFRGPNWVLLAEPNAEARLRYWSIQNLTYGPAPRSGETMLWSGTAGPDLEGAPQKRVHNQLDIPFFAPDPPAGRTQDELLLTWWQWRAGSADGGTGAVTKSQILAGNTVIADRPVVLEQGDEGWVRLGLPFTGRSGQSLTLRLDYDSAKTETFLDPATANNRGWFIDDVQPVAFRFDRALRLRYDPVNLTPAPVSFEAPATWTTRAVGDADPTVVWSLAETGAGTQDGGWRVATVEVPGQGSVPAWRFADASRQGYPSATESRVVTPLVDLSQARGDLRLMFDHKYWFESKLKCPSGGLDPEGCFRSAIDSGAIEYQVFNPATRTFGEWQPLAKGFDDFPFLHFEGKTDDCVTAGWHDAGPGDTDPGPDPCTHHRRWTDSLSDLPGNRGAPSYGGYPAIEERGFSEEAQHTSNGQWAGSSRWPLGHGTSLAGMHPGRTQFQIEIGRHATSDTPAEYLRPWHDSPVAFVFSGTSQGIDGWSSEAWDVSPLAGQQVRFALHASSNPSLIVEGDRPSDPDDRGWSVANLRIEGNSLDPKPLRLRVRISTDGSLGAGEWRIDEATVNGERFRRNAAVLADGPTQLVADHSETVTFEGRFATLGSQPLEGVVVALSALRESDLQPYPDERVDLVVPPSLVTPFTSTALPIGTVASFKLDPLDSELQPAIPFKLDVQLPASDQGVLLRWSLLQQRPDGKLAPFPLDVPGNTQSQWVARALRQAEVEIQPPTAGQTRVLVATPGNALPGQAITMTALVRNTGTTQFDAGDLKAKWSIDRVLHKGDAQQQPGLDDEDIVEDVARIATDPLGKLPRGASHSIEGRFTPPVAGLYRVRLAIEGAAHDAVTTELLVGIQPTYLGIDFAQEDAGLQGWSDESFEPTESGGGSPDHLRWRDVGDRYLWGVTEADFGAGTTYCGAPSNCDFPATDTGSSQNPPEPSPTVGLEGRAHGPRIDLTRVPQGPAFVTVRHSHNFEQDDGARLEFMPLEAGTDSPAFPSTRPGCPDGTYALAPLDPQGHAGILRSSPARFMPGGPPPPNSPGAPPVPGEYAAKRVNPLAPDTPVKGIAGVPASQQVIQYDLSMAATAITSVTCPLEADQPASLVLVNYTLVPVLRTGTRPGYTTLHHGNEERAGAQGWAIHSMQVSSRNLQASPGTPAFPVQAGASKTFFVSVTNLGQSTDRVSFTLDPATTLPSESWITLPGETQVDPGQTRRVPIRIAVPGDDSGQPGSYLAPIRVSSVVDPLAFDEVLATVQVRRVLLPDLALSLEPDLPVGAPFQAGTVVPVHATVFNVGGAASRSTQLRLWSVDEQETVQEIALVAIPTLCPPSGADCGGPNRATQTIEWTVPRAPGAYRLLGEVDPRRVMDELGEGNNVVDLDANVRPLRQPDLAVTTLDINGTTGGFAEEGSLVTISANATNLGDSPANNVRLRIRFGSTTLREVRLPSLAPGQDMTVTVAKVVGRGDFIVGASILHDAPDANIDNDDLRRPLRVRGHDLSMQAFPENLTVAPGSTISFTVNVTNHGNQVERVLLALDATATDWAARILPNPLALAPGQTGSVGVDLVAPETARAGVAALRLKATPSGHTPSTAWLTLPVAVATRAEAPAVWTPANQTLAPGNGTLAVRLESLSNVAQTLRVTVLGKDWTARPTEVRLLPGSNQTLAVAVTVPGAAAVGPHDVTIVVRDAKGAFLRSLNATVFVSALPALQGTWSGAAHQEGDDLGLRRVTYTLRVENTGNVPVQPHVRILGLGNGTTLASQPSGPVLNVGGQWLAQVVLLLEPSVDDAFGVGELWMGDGNGTVRIAVLPLPSLDAAPDLHIADVQVTPRGALTAGRTVTVRATVENVGGMESPASTVFVAINGLLVTPVAVGPLAPGESAQLVANVTFTEQGSYLLSVVADGAGVVEELEDANNGRSLPLDVGEPTLPDRLRNVPAIDASALLVTLLALALCRRRSGGRRQ